jgi:hypothetical protein
MRVRPQYLVAGAALLVMPVKMLTQVISTASERFASPRFTQPD